MVASTERIGELRRFPIPDVTDGKDFLRYVMGILLMIIRIYGIASVLLLNLIAAFQAFDEFYNILGGGGASAGNTSLARPPLVYLYSLALSNQDFGRGAAGGFILTALILAFTLLPRLFTRPGEGNE